MIKYLLTKIINMIASEMDFNAMIQKLVAEEITRQLETYTAAQALVEGKASERTESEYLSVNELSELTGLKKATIYAKRSRRELPAYRFGRELRFKREEIETWMMTRQTYYVGERRAS